MCLNQLHNMRLPRIRTASVTTSPNASDDGKLTSPQVGTAINAALKKEATRSRRTRKTECVKAFELPSRRDLPESLLLDGSLHPSVVCSSPTTSTQSSTPEAAIRQYADVLRKNDTSKAQVQRVVLSLPLSKSWRRGSLLGQGSYGSVYKAQDCDTGRVFAVKQAPLHSDDEQKCSERLKAEIDIYRSLRHPNIVTCLGSGEVDGLLCLYLEFLPAGSMASILKEFGALTEVQLQRATRGATEGLAYLHSRSPPIVHRDVKGANLLVGSNFEVKWGDFGCSRHQMNTQTFTTIGSIPWIAPEVIVQQNGYGRKADIWSLGCTVLEMATAKNPWDELGFDNIVFALQHIGMTNSIPTIPQAVPEGARVFITFCLRRRPEERPDKQQLLEHEYINGYGKELDLHGKLQLSPH